MTKQLCLSLILLIIIGGLAALTIGMKGERYALDGMDFYHRGEYKKAINQFLLADQAANGSVPEYHYWLGRLYIAEADTANTMYWLDQYVRSGDQEFRRQVDDYIRIINRQDKIFERMNVRPMPSYFNSRNSDYGAVVDPTGRYVYFTSLRPSRFDKENIWRAEIFQSGYGRPELVTELATDKNEAFGSFDVDGIGAWIFGNFEPGKIDGDIYHIEYSKKWSAPENAWQFNSPQVETHPMAFGDSLMFFASSREGGFGGMDIYVSEKVNGIWTEPQNLGPIINTSQNEQTPFLLYDGRTLFFASDGHPGFGGYDLFKAYRKGDSWQDWSIPENLGLPANSIRNDRYFYHIPGTNEGFISSYRAGANFEKIYGINFVFTVPPSYVVEDSTGTYISIDIIEEEPVPPDTLVAWEEPEEPEEPVEPEIPKPSFITITGRVIDDQGDPVQTEIQFSGIVDDERYTDYTTTDEDGEFSIILPFTDRYNLVINQEGYLLYSDQITIPEDGSPVELNIILQKLEVKKVFVFENILFFFDSSRVKPESVPILDDLVITLLSNPEINVEISGHTCDIGTAVYNQGLSERRAKAIVDHLIAKGIAKERLTWKGYGLTRPVNENKNEEERKKNRRVEVRVLE